MDIETLEKAQSIKDNLRKVSRNASVLAKDTTSKAEITTIQIDYPSFNNTSYHIQIEDYPELQESIREIMHNFFTKEEERLKNEFAAL